MTTNKAAEALLADIRAAISNAYYENRGRGQTMETAADDAAAAVVTLLAEVTAQQAAEVARLRDEREQLVAALGYVVSQSWNLRAVAEHAIEKVRPQPSASVARTALAAAPAVAPDPAPNPPGERCGHRLITFTHPGCLGCGRLLDRDTLSDDQPRTCQPEPAP